MGKTLIEGRPAAHPCLHELWLTDPDGNLIEVYARLTAEELAAKPADLESTFLVEG